MENLQSLLECIPPANHDLIKMKGMKLPRIKKNTKKATLKQDPEPSAVCEDSKGSNDEEGIDGNNQIFDYE